MEHPMAGTDRGYREGAKEQLDVAEQGVATVVGMFREQGDDEAAAAMAAGAGALLALGTAITYGLLDVANELRETRRWRR